ncbi:hypothetical protein Tco_0903460, partial [Tanacetum coccineum]
MILLMLSCMVLIIRWIAIMFWKSKRLWGNLWSISSGCMKGRHTKFGLWIVPIVLAVSFIILCGFPPSGALCIKCYPSYIALITCHEKNKVFVFFCTMYYVMAGLVVDARWEFQVEDLFGLELVYGDGSVESDWSQISLMIQSIPFSS